VEHRKGRFVSGFDGQMLNQLLSITGMIIMLKIDEDTKDIIKACLGACLFLYVQFLLLYTTLRTDSLNLLWVIIFIQAVMLIKIRHMSNKL